MPGRFVVAAFTLIHLLSRGHLPDVAFDGVGLMCLTCDVGTPLTRRFVPTPLT